MTSNSLLQSWVAASNEVIDKADKIVYTDIITYFTGLGITNFDTTAMDKIVGSGSLLNQVILIQSDAILRYGPYNQNTAPDITEII